MRMSLYGPMVVLAATCFVAGCSQRPVSFAGEVQPILARHCSECHAAGKQGYDASGLDTTSYDALMKGGKFGPMIKPGDALTSALNMLVEGRADKSIQMPHGRQKLSDAETATLKQWVNEGAKNN